ncbi:MAG: hypothetical protein LBU57_10130, partial [Dysgonamonadaceae bacterium]|nr:hypothetical protein [Dysgonamonadaceae bacterium]
MKPVFPFAKTGPGRSIQIGNRMYVFVNVCGEKCPGNGGNLQVVTSSYRELQRLYTISRSSDLTIFRS